MFLTGSSTAILPEFYKDGAKLNVVEDKTGVKMGKVEFVASGGNYVKGFAKKSFKAEIKMNDRTFTENIEYEVAQPTIRVTTGNAPTLYMNCVIWCSLKFLHLARVTTRHFRPAAQRKSLRVTNQ